MSNASIASEARAHGWPRSDERHKHRFARPVSMQIQLLLTRAPEPSARGPSVSRPFRHRQPTGFPLRLSYLHSHTLAAAAICQRHSSRQQREMRPVAVQRRRRPVNACPRRNPPLTASPCAATAGSDGPDAAPRCRTGYASRAHADRLGLANRTIVSSSLLMPAANDRWGGAVVKACLSCWPS